MKLNKRQKDSSFNFNSYKLKSKKLKTQSACFNFDAYDLKDGKQKQTTLNMKYSSESSDKKGDDDCLWVSDLEEDSKKSDNIVVLHREYCFNIQRAIERLDNNEFICDNTIDLKFELIKQDYLELFDEGKIVILPCVFYPTINKGFCRSGRYKTTIFRSDLLIWPVNYTNIHWALLVIRNLSKITESTCEVAVEYYDSSPDFRISSPTILQMFNNHLKSLNKYAFTSL